jgi:hypothetical protein
MGSMIRRPQHGVSVLKGPAVIALRSRAARICGAGGRDGLADGGAFGEHGSAISPMCLSAPQSQPVGREPVDTSVYSRHRRASGLSGRTARGLLTAPAP